MREIRPIILPLPSKLPFEDKIDKILSSAVQKIEKHPITGRLQEIKEKMPYIAETEITTPMGKFKTPEIRLPDFLPPKVDERRREAIKAAICDDFAGVIERIPFLGFAAHPISDLLEDMAMGKLHDTLTEEEFKQFKRFDKAIPSTTLALLMTFTRMR